MKVLITPRSFGKNDKSAFEMLEKEGFEIVRNSYGRIMTEDELINEIKDIDGIIIGVDPLNKNVLSKAKKLKVISKYGVGTDNIDMQYAKENNIKVTRTVGANTNAVADYAFALMMACARKISYIDKECRKLNWSKIKTIEIWGKTLGIIGLGSIGKGVAKRALGFNMNILAFDPIVDESFAKKYNIQYSSLEKVIKESDFISLHLPLNDKTKHIIGNKEFEVMKDNVIIVNTSRGGIIDEDALINALKENKIYGAGIDVFEKEPPENKEFLKLDNIILGSHCAASTLEAIDNMSIMSAQNLIDNIR